MKVQNIAVIAASPFDTQLGVEALSKKGVKALAYPVTVGGIAFTEFSSLSREERNELIRDIIKRAMGRGAQAIMIYCNALSALIDAQQIEKELQIQVVTPFMVYKQYAREYTNLAVICGTNQGLGGIERVIQGERPEDYVTGVGFLHIVHKIMEQGDPEQMFEDLGVKDLLNFFKKSGCQCLVLGCTHLPYVIDQFLKYSPIPVLDPFEIMFEMLMT